MKPTYCCVRFSFKRLQWLRLWQMTVDGFPLCKVVLNFFVYSVTSCQPELALQLMMGFNPDLTQMLMVNSYCFGAACLPYSHCWWATFWLIWQDFPGGITASYLPEDYGIICLNRQLPFPVDDVTQRACQKIILYSNQVAHVPGNSLIICQCEKQTNKSTSRERPQQIWKKHVDELMNMGQRNQTYWDEGKERRRRGCMWRAWE